MKNISVLIKPASGLCNLLCKYCFYHDEMSKRDVSSFGLMKPNTVKNIINKFLEIEDLSSISFAFQGGEPLLAGIDFYEDFIRQVNEKNKENIRVNYSIQTNGTLLNEDWVKFFKDNQFLVGLSIDGIKEIHDKYRVDEKGNNTFDLVKSKIELLNKYNVDFNILTVVTKDVAKNIDKIYNFYKNEGIIYQQYIPCLDNMNQKRGKNDYSLLPHDYEIFLNKLFDLYYKDMMSGHYVYNRYFENILLILNGQQPENCAMYGLCSIQYLIEGNGNVYPCDFYAIDRYLIGNINANTIDEINKSRVISGFIDESRIIPEKCPKCKYYKLCRAGCRRDRDEGGILGKNFFCSSYYNFLDKNLDRLKEILNHLINQKLQRQN